MHSEGFEFTKPTYTRLEDNLIRHRGDRLQYSGAVGDIARASGGSLVSSPPADDAHIQRYFGDVKSFRAIDELVTVVTKGVPVKAAPRGSTLDRALQ